MRGEASVSARTPPARRGRSPRARGSPLDLIQDQLHQRSIPACAGKPGYVPMAQVITKVDPRVRGEAPETWHEYMKARGRSPRARGSRLECTTGGVRYGSIPACAGKPLSPGARLGRRGVDPRVRGEADQEEPRMSDAEGRSPRARGSPAPPTAATSNYRSIPACAGKPSKNTPTQSEPQVDPRVRGEAVAAAMGLLRLEGRSPRARGSQPKHPHQVPMDRSIPACAGKPATTAVVATITGVDPRVRGEAEARRAHARVLLGRSPRARGSPSDLLRAEVKGRSIPACAGKP